MTKRTFIIGLLIALLTAVIAVIVLIIALSVQKAKYNELNAKYMEDEEYISAKNSRVFHYAGEKDRMTVELPGYGKVWVNACTDVPLNEADFDDFVMKDGYLRYMKDGEECSKVGIDISYHNGDIDWDRVKADGVDFAMLRAGYRGYETGNINGDDRFREYIDGASKAGIDVGVYFFSQAITEEEVLEEADFLLSQIEGYDIVYPVVFDWEVVGSGEKARTDDIDLDMLNDIAAAFCNRIAENGYIPMIYINKVQGLYKYDLDRIAGFDLWIAEYKEHPEFPYRFTIWQYATDGKVDGIEGTVDMDVSLVDYSKERR